MSTFQQDTEETPVIFRKYVTRDGNEVIALFPSLSGTNCASTCSSFMHVGQHGSADPWGVMRDTKRATPDEYADLKRELESAPYGYRLKVYARNGWHFYEARKQALQRMK